MPRIVFTILLLATAVARADETCMSPYMPKLTGQEDYVYVWTLGIDGLGDGSDKLVTIGTRPGSPTYGKVVSSVSVGGRHERTTRDSRRIAGSSGPAVSTRASSGYSTSRRTRRIRRSSRRSTDS
jgi:selenium-binding protein 1